MDKHVYLTIDGHSYKTADYTNSKITVDFSELTRYSNGIFKKEKIESCTIYNSVGNKNLVDIRRLAESSDYKDCISYWNDINGTMNVVIRSEIENAPIIVQRIENNISITGYINLNFDSNGKERAELVKKAIEEYWSGVYDIEGQQVNLTTIIKVKDRDFHNNHTYFNINVKKGNNDSNSAWVASSWRIDNNEVDMNLYWNENSSLEDIKGEIAHEFGHRLGLSDAYDTSTGRYDRLFGKVACFLTGDSFYLNKGRKAAPTETNFKGHHYFIPGDKIVKAINKKGKEYEKIVHIGEKYDVMRVERDMKVSDFDVALVLEAFKYNRFQVFPESF